MIKFLGGGKKTPEKNAGGAGKGFIPVDKVKNMSNKGFTEPEIIDALRKEGFSSKEIDSALTQSLKLGVSGSENIEASGSMPTLKDLQSQSLQPTGESQLPQELQTPPGQEMQMQANSDYADYYPADYSTEEIVESIIHEKMGEMEDKFIQFKAKDSEIERRMSDLHNQLVAMSRSRTQNEEKILSKLDSFKEEINDVNAKMSSLERAFKEALPALIESVRSLTDLVQRIKREAV